MAFQTPPDDTPSPPPAPSLSPNTLRLQELNTSPTATYDFEPFLHAPAIQQISYTLSNQISIVSIPDTKIPSPLAANIAPQTLLDLQEFLCGKARFGNKFASDGGGRNGNGNEVWESWKRAWDLWNNYFIEGRVNEGWIAEEYERIKKGEAPRGLGSSKIGKAKEVIVLSSDSDSSDDDDGSDDDAEEISVPHPNAKPTVKFYRYWRGPRDPAGGMPRNIWPPGEGLVWRRSERAPYVDKMATGRWLKRKSGKKGIVRREVIRTKGEWRERVRVKKGERIKVYEVLEKRVEGEATRLVRAKEFHPVQDWAANVDTRQRTGHAIKNVSRKGSKAAPAKLEAMGTKSEKISVSRVVMKEGVGKFQSEVPAPGSVNGFPNGYGKLRDLRLEGKLPDRVVDDKVDGKIYEREERRWVPELVFRDTGKWEVVAEDGFRPGQEKKTYRDFEDVEVDEMEDYEEEENEIWEEWVEVDNPALAKESTASKKSKKVKLPEAKKARKDKGKDIEGVGDKSSQPKEKQGGIEENGDDGSSAGFYAIKDLPDYKVPDFEGENASRRWDDVLQNSVWRPRRVGEKTLKIDLDEDIEEFYKNTELEVDGGVDCGRSPYPVLRSKIVYVKEGEGREVLFSKRKVWDEVEGTIFNMPTKPLESEPETEDKKIERTKGVYGDYIRDNRYQWENPDVFPLDIRRVFRVDPKTGKGPTEIPIAEEGQEVIESAPEFEPQPLREMLQSDPWWVTNEERENKENPARRYPPRAGLEEENDVLPFDDICWKQHVDFDDCYDARYFVTNLHGGTLIVNGMEVKKGCVAGPLPPFAVIECPGGQVAFWWGVGGRNWGEGPEGIIRGSDWDTLRRRSGWTFVGLLSGQVWASRIRDRKKRERTGEDLEDDETWDRWKQARIEGEEDADDSATVPPGNSRDVTRWNGDLDGPVEGLKTPGDEVKWLYKKNFFKRHHMPDPVHIPVGDAFWGGPHPRIESATTLTSARFEHIWSDNHEAYLKFQRKFTHFENSNKEALEQQAKANDRAIGKKRKADRFGHSDLKRGKFGDPAANLAARQKAAFEKAAERQRNKDLAEKAKKLAERQKIEEAYVASLCHKKPEHEKAAIKKKRAIEIRLEQESNDRIWQSTNVIRARKGLSPLPPREDFSNPSLAQYIEKVKEEKKKREELERKRRAEQLVQQAAAEDARKKNEIARRARQAQFQSENLQDIERRRMDHEAQVASRRQKAQDEVALAGKARENRFKKSLGLNPSPPLAGGRSKTGGGSVPFRTAAQKAQDDLDRAIAISLKDDEEQQMQEALIASLNHEQQVKDHTAAMEARAAVSGMTPEAYVDQNGFKIVSEYIRAEMAGPAEEPRWGDMPYESEPDFELRYSKYELAKALEKGMTARAKLEGKDVIDLVREKGESELTLKGYIKKQVDAIIPDMIPQSELGFWPLMPKDPTPEQRESVEKARGVVRSLMKGRKAESKRRWLALCETIDGAWDWEAMMHDLPDPAAPANGARSVVI